MERYAYLGQDPQFGHFYFSRSNLSQLLQNFVYYVYYYYSTWIHCFSSKIDVVLQNHENG